MNTTVEVPSVDIAALEDLYALDADIAALELLPADESQELVACSPGYTRSCNYTAPCYKTACGLTLM